MPEMAQIFTGESHKPNRRIPFNVKLLAPMDIVVLHGDILQPGGQLETPGLVSFELGFGLCDSQVKI